MSETWKSVVGYEGYYKVSDLGNVKGLNREIQMSDGRIYKMKGKLLEKRVWSNKYYCVTLYKENTKPKACTIHSLVMESFVGVTPEGFEICHKNGIYTDCALTNLYFGTKSDNQYDSVEHGTHFNASKEICPLKHLLEEPNLMNANKRAGARACLACSRGRATVNNNKRRGIVLEFEQEAHRHYQIIMTNNQPKSIRTLHLRRI